MGIGTLRRYHANRKPVVTEPPSEFGVPRIPKAGEPGFELWLEEQMKNPAFAQAFAEESSLQERSEE